MNFLLGWLPGRCELLVSRRVHLQMVDFPASHLNFRRNFTLLFEGLLDQVFLQHMDFKYIGGQMEIILHQPWFAWNSRAPISLANPPIWGAQKSCELPKRRICFSKISSKRPRPTAIFPAPTYESSIVATWTFPSHPWIRHAPAPGKFLDVGKGVK